MDRKAFVLLSGGLDSTTCLYQAIHDYFPKDPGLKLGYGDPFLIKQALQDPSADIDIPWVEAVSIDYGQRHKKETIHASKICTRLGIKHSIIDVGQILGGANVMLSADSLGKVEVPNISYSDIKGVSPTYVPNRNMLMLSVLGAHAQKWVNSQISRAVENYDRAQEVRNGISMRERGISLPRIDMTDEVTKDMRDSCGIYFGAHADDALNWAYPDCTPEFIGSMANALYVASYFTIRLHTPIMWLTKDRIVELGDRLGVPFGMTWSCYKGETAHCGVCPTCRSRREAFVAANIHDPTEYADKPTEDIPF